MEQWVERKEELTIFRSNFSLLKKLPQCVVQFQNFFDYFSILSLDRYFDIFYRNWRDTKKKRKINIVTQSSFIKLRNQFSPPRTRSIRYAVCFRRYIRYICNTLLREQTSSSTIESPTIRSHLHDKLEISLSPGKPSKAGYPCMRTIRVNKNLGIRKVDKPKV